MKGFFVDTHAHLYLQEFDDDIDQVISRALEQNVTVMMLPNIDSGSLVRMNSLASCYPANCFPMAGLHPTSVRENYGEELALVREELKSGKYYGIGETGIDLYWEQKYRPQQQAAFDEQIKLALEYSLPVVIHARNSFDEILEIVEGYRGNGLKGIFHAFSGDMQVARRVIDLGFKIGTGGVVTYKKSSLAEVVREAGLEYIVLETDSPYLAPVPYRGKRNESAWIRVIADILAAITAKDIEEVSFITTCNALDVFNKLPHDISR